MQQVKEIEKIESEEVEEKSTLEPPKEVEEIKTFEEVSSQIEEKIASKLNEHFETNFIKKDDFNKMFVKAQNELNKNRVIIKTHVEEKTDKTAQQEEQELFKILFNN